MLSAIGCTAACVYSRYCAVYALTMQQSAKKPYTPPQHILENYAKVMVHFALWRGKGIKKGETVLLAANESAKPLFWEIYKAILKAGGNVIMYYLPDGADRYQATRIFFEYANKAQRHFFPGHFMRGIVDEVDHLIYIISEDNPHALSDVDPKKLMEKDSAFKPYKDYRDAKEYAGKFSWTLCLYGTLAMAREAGLSERQYWNQITKACFLDEEDPIRQWRQVDREIAKYRDKLNAVSRQTEYFHMFGPDVDMHIALGEKRKWINGGGVNIPTFEIFTSPDWRGVEGWMRFNQPLYRYGNLITDIELEFKNGRVVKSRAGKNAGVLKAMINTPNADKVGEWSLTDKRHSRITKFMAETLYDENVGGRHGNSHIALGKAYNDTYDGDVTKLTQKQAEKLGFNSSSVHTDIISTTPRTVVAHLTDGSERVVYKDGSFVL